MNELRKEGLIKELERLREKMKESAVHLKKLRKEMKLTIKRLERKRKLPNEVDEELDKIEIMVLRSFHEAFLNILEQMVETIKEGSEELKTEEASYGPERKDSETD